MSIENAAAEIMRTYLRNPQVGRFHEITEIIRRHLLPAVKPEEVEQEKFYFLRATPDEAWAIVPGSYLMVESDEIRGPIQQPE